MPILLSKACEYALQSMLFLASQPPHKPIFQRDISTFLGIPPHFLGKVLQALVRNKLVISQRGKAGGFVLGKSPKEITPHDIIEAIEGETFLDGCFLGFPGCSDAHPCPVHVEWQKIRQHVTEMLLEKNLQTLSESFIMTPQTSNPSPFTRQEVEGQLKE